MSGGGEEQRKARGSMGCGEKKKEIKRKKEIGSGIFVYGEKKGGEWKRKKKKFESEKTKFVLLVHSLCLVQSVKL